MATILAEDNFTGIFLNENDRILIQISLKFVPRNLIDNMPALVQVMAWCWLGNKPGVCSTLVIGMLNMLNEIFCCHTLHNEVKFRLL